MTSVLVTVPNVHWIHQHVTAALLKLHQDRRYELAIQLPSHRPYENNLHHIVRVFLDEGHDFWLNIDADNPPANGNPLDLVELDLDIVGIPTPIFHYQGEAGEFPVYWNVYYWNEGAGAYNQWRFREGLQEVDAIGTGCFLASRRVFENEKMQAAPFQRTYFKDGTVEFGNDMAFCQRAKRQGFKVWAHYGYWCNHFHEVELNEIARAASGAGHG